MSWKSIKLKREWSWVQIPADPVWELTNITTYYVNLDIHIMNVFQYTQSIYGTVIQFTANRHFRVINSFLWFYNLSFIVIMGVEINCEQQHVSTWSIYGLNFEHPLIKYCHLYMHSKNTYTFFGGWGPQSLKPFWFFLY